MAELLERIDAWAAELRGLAKVEGRCLGSMRIGSSGLIQAMSPVDASPELRVNGRVTVRFDPVKGLRDAQQAARRAFERVANRELQKPRTRAELRQTLMLSGVTLQGVAEGDNLSVRIARLELVEEP